MAEIGIDISQEFPKPGTEEIVGAADVVVTMVCGDAYPLVPSKRRHTSGTMKDRHPGNGRVLPAATVTSFHRALEILRARGFDDEIAAAVIRSLISYAFGYGLGEHTCLGAPGRRPGDASTDATDLLVALGRALPADTPRALVDAAVAVLECDTEVCFEFGLDLLIVGADRQRTRRK